MAMLSYRQFLFAMGVAIMCQHVLSARHRHQAKRQPGDPEVTNSFDGVADAPELPQTPIDIPTTPTTTTTTTTTTTITTTTTSTTTTTTTTITTTTTTITTTTTTTTTSVTAAPSTTIASATSPPTTTTPNYAPPSCCGAHVYTSEAGETFKIGEGDGVDYKPNPAECLSNCEAKEASATGCNSPWQKFKTSKKVSKLQLGGSVKKLCCKVQKCTWRPKAKAWEVMTKSDDMQLAPLTMFQGKSVSGNTCFCCKEKKLPWTSAVNDKCMLAFKPTTAQIYQYAFGATFTAGVTDMIFKGHCAKYCAHFPEYPEAKKSLESHSWK